MGEEPAYFIYPSLVMLASLALMALGFFRRGPREVVDSKKIHVSETRLHFVLVILLLTSLYATYQFVQNTGGFASGQLSGKRTVIFDLDVQGDADFNQYGHLRQMANLASFAFLILLGHLLFDKKTVTPLSIAALAVLFLTGIALPFYSSSRLPIVWLFCGTGAVVWYSGRDVNWKRIAVIGLVGLSLFHFMSVIRGKADWKHNLEERSGFGSMVDRMILTSNYCGLSKSSHIINAIPEVLEIEYGKTIGVWLVAPVPRSMWANKPMISPGPIIGTKIYGNRVSGVPPGLIAELYWNFHLPGVLIGAWLFGNLLRTVADRFRPVRGQASLHGIVYIVGPMRLGFELLGNSIGFGIIITLIDMATILVILYFVADRTAHRPVAGRITPTLRQPQPATTAAA